MVLVIFLATVIGCQSSLDRSTPNVQHDTWFFSFDSTDVGLQQKWYADSCDRSRWGVVKSGYWADLAGKNYDGVAWYASMFDLQDSAKQYSIFVEGADDEADVWINGIMVGSHAGYDESFAFEIPTAHAGRNTVVLRVTDRGGPGGLYKPVQIVRSIEVSKLLKSKYADKNAFSSADWVRSAVIYEVYLRSFSKDGSFKSLEKRLPELKSLGISVVWLMPIHPVGELARKGRLGSPYSVQDFYGINPEFGTLADFKSLVASVHRLGLKIIIDLVANHTSWDSELILEHPDWFKMNDEGAIVSPNGDWTDVAQLDYQKHELRKYMIGMMEYWVRDIGIDGYRCDVADLLPLDFWEIARGELEKIKPVIMLAEGKKPEDHLKAFDLTYSWNLYDVLADVVHGGRPVRVLDDIVNRERLEYPKNSLRLRFDTNHDKTVKDGPPIRRYTSGGVRAAAALIFTYPGVPLVYNGEEVGNPRKLDLFDNVDIDWTKGEAYRDLFTTLTLIRNQHQALSRGEYARVWCSDSTRVYAFERTTSDDKVTVVINFSDEKKEISLKAANDFDDLFSGKKNPSDGKRIRLSLAPYGFAILVPQEKEANH